MKRTLATYTWIVVTLLVGCEWKPPRIPPHLLKEKAASEIKTPKVLISTPKSTSLETLSKKKQIVVQEEKQVPKKSVKSENLRVGSLTSSLLPAGNLMPDKREIERVKTSPSPSSNDPIETADLSATLTPDPTASEYLYVLPPNSDPQIYLKQLVVAKNIRRRRPYGVAKEFSVDTKDPITGFVTVRNFERPQRIKFKWVHQGKVRQINTLKVGISPRWRTWKQLLGKHRRKRSGEWFLEVYSDRKRLLGRTRFILN